MVLGTDFAAVDLSTKGPHSLLPHLYHMIRTGQTVLLNQVIRSEDRPPRNVRQLRNENDPGE